MAKKSNGSGRYAVGYGRPPAASQFRKGESGNPKGRPKGSRNFTTLVMNQLEKTVTVTERGRTRVITKGEVVATQMVNDAARGDARARRDLMLVTRAAEAELAAAAAAEEIHPDDHQVLAMIAKRMQAHRGKS